MFRIGIVFFLRVSRIVSLVGKFFDSELGQSLTLGVSGTTNSSYCWACFSGWSLCHARFSAYWSFFWDKHIATRGNKLSVFFWYCDQSCIRILIVFFPGNFFNFKRPIFSQNFLYRIGAFVFELHTDTTKKWVEHASVLPHCLASFLDDCNYLGTSNSLLLIFVGEFLNASDYSRENFRKCS